MAVSRRGSCPRPRLRAALVVLGPRARDGRARLARPWPLPPAPTLVVVGASPLRPVLLDGCRGAAGRPAARWAVVPASVAGRLTGGLAPRPSGTRPLGPRSGPDRPGGAPPPSGARRVASRGRPAANVRHGAASCRAGRAAVVPGSPGQRPRSGRRTARRPPRSRGSAMRVRTCLDRPILSRAPVRRRRGTRSRPDYRRDRRGPCGTSEGGGGVVTGTGPRSSRDAPATGADWLRLAPGGRQLHEDGPRLLRPFPGRLPPAAREPPLGSGLAAGMAGRARRLRLLLAADTTAGRPRSRSRRCLVARTPPGSGSVGLTRDPPLGRLDVHPYSPPLRPPTDPRSEPQANFVHLDGALVARARWSSSATRGRTTSLCSRC